MVRLLLYSAQGFSAIRLRHLLYLGFQSSPFFKKFKFNDYLIVECLWCCNSFLRGSRKAYGVVFFFLHLSFHRIRKGRIFVGRLRGRFKPFSHLVRRLKMFFHGYWHWVYPRRGLLNVYFRRKRRPFRVNNNGKPQLFYKNRWFGFGRRKVPLIMRLRYRNSWRAVVKRKGRWCIRVGAGYRKLILRGHRFGVRINGRWQYLQARNRLQIRFRNRWRWVRNCCNRLRAVLHGKLRRIRLRGGQAMYKTNNGKWRSIRSGSFRSVSFRLRRIRGRY